MKNPSSPAMVVRSPAQVAAGHAVGAHQPPDPLAVHDKPAVAEFAPHARHAVVAVGGVEDLVHCRDQLGLVKDTLSRWRVAALQPLIEPGRGHLDRGARGDHCEPFGLAGIDTPIAGHSVDSFTQKATVRLSKSRSIGTSANSRRNPANSTRSSIDSARRSSLR